ncbi:NPP1 family protein [Streptomyces sp. NPDC005648]|uniref:NPP1 family protein n=1 Tax=Streptomyces sp. NPDC005648 TaxID=3157044 RepID=UPI0033B5023C
MFRAFIPHFDYDSDSCFPSSAIGPDGTVNGGLRPSGSMTGGCRTGHLFEKDQGDPTPAS